MAAKRSRETGDNLESSPGQQQNEPHDSSQPSTSQPQMQTRLQIKRLRILAKMAPPPGLRISDTNDDALRLILEELSLQELIPLRIICKWWKAIIEQICHGKRSLKLFNGRTSIREYYIQAQALLPYEPALQLSPAGKFNDDLILNPKKVNSAITNEAKIAQRKLDSQFLVDLFPGITSLVIGVRKTFFPNSVLNRCFAKYDFTYLLSQWPNLETLVFTNFPMSLPGLEKTDFSPELVELETTYWTTINELTFLENLFILGNVSEYEVNRPWPSPKATFEPVELALSRLKVFTCYNDNYLLDFNYYFAQLKNCSKLKLSLHNDFFQLSPKYYQHLFHNEVHQEVIATINNHLAVNLTHLELNLNVKRNLYMSVICDHFMNLTVLRNFSNTQIFHMSFKATVHQLAKLTKLTELWIPFEANGLFAPLHGHLPALTSVKILRLTICTFETLASFVPSAQSYQTLQHVFPGLEEVHIACRTKLLLDEAKSCFTNTFFPALKSTLFYDDPKKMLTPSAVQFMGQHASFLKKLDSRL